MDIEQDLLVESSAYEVLLDKKSVGPIVKVSSDSKSTVERQDKSVEGVMSVVLACSGPLRGKSLDVRFCKALKDVDEMLFLLTVSWRCLSFESWFVIFFMFIVYL